MAVITYTSIEPEASHCPHCDRVVAAINGIAYSPATKPLDGGDHVLSGGRLLGTKGGSRKRTVRIPLAEGAPTSGYLWRVHSCEKPRGPAATSRGRLGGDALELVFS